MFLFISLFVRFLIGGYSGGQENGCQRYAVDTLFNYSKEKQIIAIKRESTASVYNYYRQTGECVQAILIPQQSLSCQLEELGPYLSRVLDKLLGEERNELGLWAFFVLLFNNENKIEEVIIMEPHPSDYEEQFQLIRQALQMSDDFWKKPFIGDYHYYFTIGRCHVY